MKGPARTHDNGPGRGDARVARKRQHPAGAGAPEKGAVQKGETRR